MQHLDEGTIHSWLDDALGAEEAARFESHVAECAECAAKVAEARGFIAASSRILTALDDVPGGVVPIARPRVSRFGPAWRAAAAVLVVAGGSLLVLRDGEKGRDTVTATTAISAPDTRSAPVRSESAALSIADGIQTSSPSASVGASAPQAQRSGVTAQPPAAPKVTRLSETVMGSRDAAKAADMQSVVAGTGVSGSIGGVPGALATAAAPSPLRLLSDSSGTVTRTLRYAVGASDTVILTELTPVVNLRGARSADAARAPAEAAARTAQANQRRVQTPSAPLPAPPPPPASSQPAPATGSALDRAESAPAVNTVRWVDAATGRTLTLSGKLPVARLQEIRLQIERQRAAIGR